MGFPTASLLHKSLSSVLSVYLYVCAETLVFAGFNLRDSFWTCQI